MFTYYLQCKSLSRPSQGTTLEKQMLLFVHNILSRPYNVKLPVTAKLASFNRCTLCLNINETTDNNVNKV